MLETRKEGDISLLNTHTRTHIAYLGVYLRVKGRKRETTRMGKDDCK